MPVINRMAELHDEIAAWRRDIHSQPELGYDVHSTAAKVASRLREFGCDEVATGIGRTGVVGVIRGRQPGPAIGLRADMDALPIREATGKPWASTVEGKMHACGHDGHTAMLLGAAKYLAETRNFAGTAVVIFQPAEEDGAGGAAMVADGLMDRFAIEEVYGLHNEPGLPVGQFAIRPGGVMASTDEFEITFRGHGGHAASPHLCADPVIAAAQFIQAAQTIVARGVDPVGSAVVSITQVHAGTVHNVIAETAWLNGTIRTLAPEWRDLAERRLREIAHGVAAANAMSAEVVYERSCPVTVNHAAQTAKAAAVARSVVGHDKVDDDMPPTLGGEDFAFMLEARPGAFIFMGNGDTAGLHTPMYDFNDQAIPYGTSYWAKLVETLLPVR